MHDVTFELSIKTIMICMTQPALLDHGTLDIFDVKFAQWSRKYLHGYFFCNQLFPGSLYLLRAVPHVCCFLALRHFAAKGKSKAGILMPEVEEICVRSAPFFVFGFSLRILLFMWLFIAAFVYIVWCIIFLTCSKPNGCKARMFS